MALPSAGPTDCSSGLSARIFNNFRYDNPWQASQGGVAATPDATLCCPTVPNGIGYKCTAITTGITGSSEPTWPLILGNTVVDGGVTWTAQDVANPTAKAHPPPGKFGYALTSGDLDGFRLLAYDIAKGACDEIVADAVSAIYYASVAQNLATGAWTVVNYDTKVVDTDNAVATGVGWAFTVPPLKGGRYVVQAQIGANPAAAGGILGSEIDKGAGTQYKVGVPTNLFATAATFGYLATFALADEVFAAGDVIQIRGWQNTGAVLAVSLGRGGSFVSIERVLGS